MLNAMMQPSVYTDSWIIIMVAFLLLQKKIYNRLEMISWRRKARYSALLGLNKSYRGLRKVDTLGRHFM